MRVLVEAWLEVGIEEQLRDQCNGVDARLLRLVCRLVFTLRHLEASRLKRAGGDTCGCSDPLALPWYHVPAMGCADARRQARLSSAEDSCATAVKQRTQCQDHPNDAKWKELLAAEMNLMKAEIVFEVKYKTACDDIKIVIECCYVLFVSLFVCVSIETQKGKVDVDSGFGISICLPLMLSLGAASGTLRSSWRKSSRQRGDGESA